MTEGHVTAHFNRCPGDCDTRPQDVDAGSGQASRLTPAQASKSTRQHHGLVLVGHGVDQLLHFELGKESRPFEWFRR